MSILQKILEDMYVEPELLAELDEEQKQILFCKMREEQLRRWRVREAELENAEKTNGSKRSDVKIQWLLGNDGEPWVWVMGEGPGDKTIDEILEDEAQQQAAEIAEQHISEGLKKIHEEIKEETKTPDALEKLLEEETLKRLEEETQKQLIAQQNKENESKIQQQINMREARCAQEKLEREQQQEKRRLAAKERMQREIEAQQEREKALVDEKSVVFRLKPEAEKIINEVKERRASEIYDSIKKAREEIAKQAEIETVEEEKVWQEQEKKSKEHEEQIRAIARRAREQHRANSLRTSTSLSSVVDEVLEKHKQSSHSLKLPRPEKPMSRDAVVSWFVSQERPMGAGIDPRTGLVAPWFHGIISRQQSEDLLSDKHVGAYLLRVSERICGYAVSYKALDKIKHFLIEHGHQGYQFLGTHQMVHATLWDLVAYHKDQPITAKDKEFLIEPVGQNKPTPDYQELLPSGKPMLRF